MRIALTKTGLLLGIVLVLGSGKLWAQQPGGLSDNWDESAASYPSAPLAEQYAPGVPVASPAVPVQPGAPGGVFPMPQNFGPPQSYAVPPNQVPTAPPGQINPWVAPYADHYPLAGLYLFQDVNTFRNFANGDGSNNNGIAQGFNLGVPLPWMSQYGFGAQLGASYGVYNFSGRRPDAAGSNGAEQQVFITTGVFRHADADRRFSGGVVFDLMMNDHYGVFNAPPTMGQVRFQAGYALGYFNEIGAWGTVEAFSDTVTIYPNAPIAYTQAYFRPINMLNVYWRHKWGLGGAETTIFGGVPHQTALTDPVFGRNFGIVTAGGSANVPLTDCFALYGNLMYLQPDAHTGFTPLKETWNISVGVAWYPGRTARSSTVAGRSSMPLLPVANNGSFLVNTNRTL